MYFLLYVNNTPNENEYTQNKTTVKNVELNGNKSCSICVYAIEITNHTTEVIHAGLNKSFVKTISKKDNTPNKTIYTTTS